MAYPQPDDGCVNGSVGGVAGEVGLCALSQIAKCGVSQGVSQCLVPVSVTCGQERSQGVTLFRGEVYWRWVGVRLRCRPIGHGIAIDAHMGWHPLEVYGETGGGEAVKEAVDGYNEAVVGARAVVD